MKRIVVAAGIVFFVASLSFAAPPDSAQYRAKVSPQIADQMSKMAGPIPAIVTLWDQEVTKPSLGELRFEHNIDAYIAEADRTVDEAMRAAGITNPKARYHAFAGFAADLTPDQIERLVDNPLVRRVSPDMKMVPLRREGNALMNVPPVHALGKKGAGVSVAIIDDGVYYAHPELGGGTFPNALVVDGYDYIANVRDPSPDVDTSTGELETHGTAVAGIIAGQGDPVTGATGVAPQAKLVAFRASSADHLASALDYIATHATGQSYPPIKVINMSIGFTSAGHFSSNCDSLPDVAAFKTLFDRLNSLGIVSVASAGNEAQTNGVLFPACMSKLVAVGAVYDANVGGWTFPDAGCTDASSAADQVTCYSNSADIVALLAPSDTCRTPKAGVGGPYLDDFNGTSAAAPYVAGSFAVLMSSFPGGTPEQYRDIFKSTGKSISDPKSGRSTPRVDLYAAYQALAGNGGGTKSNIYIVPASARVQGSGAFFQTDVRIFNKTSTTANVDMFLLNAIDNASNTGVTFTVTGGQVRPIDDVIGQALGLGSGIGGLLFASDQPLVITSDTYALNTCPGVGGTLGQFIPAVAINKGGTSQRLYHVINDSRFYTNFGVVNTGTSQATINVTVRSGTGGALGTTKQITLGAFGWTQVSKLLDSVGAGSTSNAYIDVTSNVAVVAYTSVVDRKTSDPFFVLGENQ